MRRLLVWAAWWLRLPTGPCPQPLCRACRLRSARVTVVTRGGARVTGATPSGFPSRPDGRGEREPEAPLPVAAPRPRVPG